MLKRAMFVVPVVLALVGSAATAQEARMQGLVGNWSCVSHMGKQSMNYALTYAKANDHWLSYTGKYPAGMGDPAHTDNAYFGYDKMAKQWVFMSTSTTGEYFVGTSTASPDAKKQTWTTAYPKNPAMAGTLVIDYTTPNQMLFDASFTVKGKPMTSHDVCKKG